MNTSLKQTQRQDVVEIHQKTAGISPSNNTRGIAETGGISGGAKYGAV